VGKPARRSSSIANSLLKVSAAKRVSVAQVLLQQDVHLVPAGGAGASSKGVSPPLLDRSRAPPKKLVRLNKVMASGGRGVSPAFGSGKSGMGSGSATLSKFKSRIDMLGMGGASGNIIKDPGMKSFLPSKPKAPTLEEIQELKEEERRRKEEKEEEARRRREELIKKKAEEQREKREERIRRVQEARLQNENQRENRIRTNQAKENEEKLAALKKREERQKEEAEKKRKEAELRMRQAEERRRKEEEERKAKAEEEAARVRDEEKTRRLEEEEAADRKRRLEQQRREEKQLLEQQRRVEKLEKQRKEEKQRVEEARILREKEELNRIKEREAADAKAKVNLNSTYSKPGDTTVALAKTVNTTYQMDSTQGVESYDMTPHRLELPPEPSKNEDDYGLDDLNSEEDTDDDENPKKQVPKWADGALLRTALLKQSYMTPDLDLIFEVPVMPDLTLMFAHQRKRFYKRTSSACWKTPPSSFKHSGTNR